MNDKSLQIPYAMNQRELLGQQIVALRREMGSVKRPLSRDDLAEELTTRLRRVPPIAGTTIRKWEQGQGFPDPWALVALARMANTTVEAFVYPRQGTPPAAAPNEAAPEEAFGSEKDRKRASGEP